MQEINLEEKHQRTKLGLEPQPEWKATTEAYCGYEFRR